MNRVNFPPDNEFVNVALIIINDRSKTAVAASTRPARAMWRKSENLLNVPNYRRGFWSGRPDDYFLARQKPANAQDM